MEEYDYQKIKHVCDPFFSTMYALRDVASAVGSLVERRAAEREMPFDKVLESYGKRWDCDPALLPDGDFLRDRISNAQDAANRLRPALYVAEHGPLFRPFAHIGNSPRTIFDRVLDRLNVISEPLVMAIPTEWSEKYEEWDALAPEARCAKMIPVYLAAVQSAHCPIITTNAQMKIDEMWQKAQIANRLMETLGRAHQPLLDGSLVIAEIGFLARASPGQDGEINDMYPVADRLPQDFPNAEDWRRYASLVQELRRVAPQIGVMDQDVSDVLCVAEQLALAHYELGTEQCDQSIVDRAADHFDRVKFSQAYWRIRSAIRDRLRKLIPDGGTMWAEAFGQWASDVSIDDAAMLAVVLPESAIPPPAKSNDMTLAKGLELGDGEGEPMITKAALMAETVDTFGNVTNPADKTAYTAAGKIVADYSQTAFNLKHLHQILRENPSIRRWKPSKQRLSIHLGDWVKYAERGKQDGDDDPTDIESRKETVRNRKLNGK